MNSCWTLSKPRPIKSYHIWPIIISWACHFKTQGFKFQEKSKTEQRPKWNVKKRIRYAEHNRTWRQREVWCLHGRNIRVHILARAKYHFRKADIVSMNFRPENRFHEKKWKAKKPTKANWSTINLAKVLCGEWSSKFSSWEVTLGVEIQGKTR